MGRAAKTFIPRCRAFDEFDGQCCAGQAPATVTHEVFSMGQRIFAIGVVLLLLGLQLRAVDSYVLSPKATRFIHEKTRDSGFRTANDPYNFDSYLMAAGPVAKKTITPPRWLGWAAISVGAVLALHGMTLRND